MIRLKVDSDTITFNQNTVLIGKGDVDVELSGDAIENLHLKIDVIEDRAVVSNLCNDPFAALNSLPFGKKTLKENDQITIGKHTIEFIEGSEAVKEIPAEPLPTENEENLALEALVKRAVEEVKVEAEVEVEVEVEAEIEKKPEPVEPPTEEISVDEEHERWENDYKETEIGATILANSNWKLLATFLFAMITLSTVIASGVYFRASGKNSQEEKKVAAGVADIAMALTTAQLYNITPNKLNWSDPDFLHTHMKLVLSSDLHPQAHLNSQGHFTDNPYFLRVYTSSDTSRFLVIAQPLPNMFQWLVHKKAVVIDSSAMEVRKIVDLKALNRLLANPNPLQGANGDLISRFVSQGDIMPLPSLSGKKNRWGFTPPNSLGTFRPGAENYIYNAPRYYPFGEAVLQRALALLENLSDSYEVSMLQQEMEKISKFRDIVLYSSQGLQMALGAQQALHTFAPKSQFLVAFLKLNPKGIVTSSHLLIDDESSDIALANPVIPQIAPMEALIEEEETHPLYLQLNSIANNRERSLKLLSEEMVEMLKKQTKMALKGFYIDFLTLLEDYQRIDTYQDRKMTKDIADLYQDYSEIPVEKFMEYITEAGLEHYVRPAIYSTTEVFEVETEERFIEIDNAKNLSQLEKITEKTAKVLKLENIPDPKLLISYQDEMRERVLQKLASLILSPDSSLVAEKADLPKLNRILRTSWVTDDNEFNYFISEFHALIKEEPSELE